MSGAVWDIPGSRVARCVLCSDKPGTMACSRPCTTQTGLPLDAILPMPSGCGDCHCTEHGINAAFPEVFVS